MSIFYIFSFIVFVLFFFVVFIFIILFSGISERSIEKQINDSIELNNGVYETTRKSPIHSFDFPAFFNYIALHIKVLNYSLIGIITCFTLNAISVGSTMLPEITFGNIAIIYLLVSLSVAMVEYIKKSYSKLDSLSQNLINIQSTHTFPNFSWEEFSIDNKPPRNNYILYLMPFIFFILYFISLLFIGIGYPLYFLTPYIKNGFPFLVMFFCVVIARFISSTAHGFFHETRAHQMGQEANSPETYLKVTSTGITIGEWHTDEIFWTDIELISIFRSRLHKTYLTISETETTGIIIKLRDGAPPLIPFYPIDKSYTEFLRNNNRPQMIVANLETIDRSNIIHTSIKHYTTHNSFTLLPFDSLRESKLTKAIFPYPIHQIDQYRNDGHGHTSSFGGGEF